MEDTGISKNMHVPIKGIVGGPGGLPAGLQLFRYAKVTQNTPRKTRSTLRSSSNRM